MIKYKCPKFNELCQYISSMKRCFLIYFVACRSFLVEIHINDLSSCQKNNFIKLKTETNLHFMLSFFEGTYTLSITIFNYTAKYLSE